MKWNKLGRIVYAEQSDIAWFKKNVMVPVPYLIDQNCLRIFATFCDEKNIGRIGYIDVNPQNPTEIIKIHPEPIIDIGTDGHFDDNGVVTSSIYKDGEKLYLYYSGYQLQDKVPYTIFSGVALSEDNGNTFHKLSCNVPILDRDSHEIFTRCAPFVMKIGDHYRVWYTGDSADRWIVRDQKLAPVYDLKYFDTDSLLDWQGKVGAESVRLIGDDEHGIAKSTIWQEDGVFKIIYSIRSITNGYRLGYGESLDGTRFERMDDQIGISVSESGWDSEMIAFAERVDVNGRVYMFYCGNHYGLEGFGCAELVVSHD